jgi:hypothetical protein
MISVHFTTVIDFKSAANGDNDTFKNSGLEEEFILRHPLMVGL